MQKYPSRYNSRLPKHGLGAIISGAGKFLAKNTDTISGLATGAAAAGQVGSPNGFKGFLSGAGSGVSLGSALGPIGMVAGGLVGGVLGLLKGKKKKAELDAQLEGEASEEALAQKRFEQNEAATSYAQSQGVLNQYPTEGVMGVNYYGKSYAYGGRISGKRRMLRRAMYGGDPKYLAEDAEVVEYDQSTTPQVHSGGQVNPISGTMAEVEGDSHSDPSGGVAMSGGEKIYSDRIKPSEMATEVLKSYRIRPNGTYADVAKRIGKAEAKQDVDLYSDDRFKKERANRTKQKLTVAKEILFADQEATKPVDNMATYKYGGKTPKYGFGALTGIGKGVADAAKFLKNKPKLDIALPNSTQGEFYRNILNRPTVGSNKSGSGIGGLISKVGGFLGDNVDMLASGAGYLANQRTINEIPLTQKTRMYNPTYLDTTRRDGLQQSRIATSARQGMRYLTSGSTQTRNAAIGDIVSRSIDGSNQVSDAENRRIDNINQNNVQTANQAGLYNTEMTNRGYGDYQQNRMLKLGEDMNNRNTLIQGILGNLETRMLNDRDRQMMALIAERDKERGIIGRSETLTNTMDRYTKKKRNG